MQKKRNIVEWCMHNHSIVILMTTVLVLFGVYALVRMNKNEFPDFTVRQGVVIAAYPGASVDEMEEQVTKPLENYIFTYIIQCLFFVQRPGKTCLNRSCIFV